MRDEFSTQSLCDRCVGSLNAGCTAASTPHAYFTCAEATATHSYEEALAVIMEYVDVE